MPVPKTGALPLGDARLSISPQNRRHVVIISCDKPIDKMPGPCIFQTHFSPSLLIFRSCTNFSKSSTWTRNTFPTEAKTRLGDCSKKPNKVGRTLALFGFFEQKGSYWTFSFPVSSQTRKFCSSSLHPSFTPL